MERLPCQWLLIYVQNASSPSRQCDINETVVLQAAQLMVSLGLAVSPRLTLYGRLRLIPCDRT